MSKEQPKKPLRLPLKRPYTPDDIISLARVHGPLAIETLCSVACEGSTDSSRVAAANALLDRGFGKIGQPLEISGPDKSAVSIQHEASPAVMAMIERLTTFGEGKK